SFHLLPPTLCATLSLHDALPIYSSASWHEAAINAFPAPTMEDPTPSLVGAAPSLRQASAGRPSRRSHNSRNCPLVKCHPSPGQRSEEHTSELQSRENLVCRLLLE